MLRVLQIIDSLEAGGAERLAVNLANELVDGVDSSALFCTRKEGLLKETINDNVNYLYINKRKTIDFKALRKAHRFIRSEKITVIHAHSSSFFFASQLKLVNPKVKLVWHDHYGDSENLKSRTHKVVKICSRLFHAIISVNEVLRSWSNQNLNCNRVYYLQNFTTQPNYSARINEIFGEPGFRIVCLANLREQKNHLYLLNAFKFVLGRFNRSTLHLIGADNQDDYSRSIKEAVISLNLEKEVMIYGSRLDTADLLSHMNLGVLSSRSEGLPISLLEYGMNKLPVVVTDVGACSEVVGGCGQVVGINEVNDLANAIALYLENPELAANQASEFHQRVVQNYGSKPYIEKLLKIYNS
jgi:glycosyltransferase involved in cell wall biosynthesis